MTQILNNMKRKEKKGLFYLIGIAIMVAIMGISCSANATAPADFSETEDFIEVPAPEVKPEQTPQKPVLPIDKTKGAVQFDGKTFENVKDKTHKVTIIVRPDDYFSNLNVAYGVSTKGEEYKFESNPYEEYAITHGGRNGKASFSEDGYLKIWFNNNQSDRETFILVK